MYDFFIQYIVPTLGTAIATLLLWVVKFLMDKYKLTEKYSQVYDAFEIGVHKVQEEYVAGLKRASADGALTPEERKEAMMRAWEAARSYVTDPKIKTALEQLTMDEVNNIVKKILPPDDKK